MKFGVIGTNFVSDFFMNGARQVDECDVVAVCDICMSGAQQFAAKHQIPSSYDSYQKMFEDNIVDAVYVAVPNGLHMEVSMYFLSRGIPVFCEKPMAGNIAQVEAMIQCAKENKTYLQEGLIPLYNPNYAILKEHLPLVGKIHQVNLNFSKYSSRYDAYLRGENPTTFRADLANGAVMDLGVYIFADCIGLWGEPKRILSAASLLDTGADVAGSSIFVYDDFNVNLTYSKATDTQCICEICGENGQLIIDQPSQPQNIFFVNRLTKEQTSLGVSVQENFYYEIKEMIAQVESGHIESSKVPFETSLAIHRTLTQCRQLCGIHFPCDKQ